MHRTLLAAGLFTTLALPALAEARPKEAPPIAPIIRALGVDPDEASPLTPGQREVAHRAGERLVSLCPHCRLSTIDEEGPCGWARSNRQIIQRAAAAGMDAETIVKRYVETYGPEVLAVDTSEGRYQLTWIVPYVGVAAGLGIVFVVGRRARRRREPEPAIDTAPDVDPSVRSRLDEELSKLE